MRLQAPSPVAPSPPAAPPQSRLRSAATHRSRRRRRSPRRGRPQAVPSAKRGGGAQTAGAGSRQTRATGRSCESSISRPARPAAAAAASAPRTVAVAPAGACASRPGACAVRRRTQTSRCNCAASAERARSCRSPSRSTGTSPPPRCAYSLPFPRLSLWRPPQMCGRARRSAVAPGCAGTNGRASKHSKRQPRVCRSGRFRRCASRGRPDAPQRAAYARVCGLAWRLGHTGSRRRRRTRSTCSCKLRSASSAPCVWGTTTRASRPAGAALCRQGCSAVCTIPCSMAHGMQGTAWNSRGSHAHWRRLCPCWRKHSNTHSAF